MLETLMSSAIGRWIASKIAALGITAALALVLAGGYFYHQYTVKSLKSQNVELTSQVTLLSAENTQLKQINAELNEQLALKVSSDKASDTISEVEAERKQEIAVNTDKSVDRIRQAFNRKPQEVHGDGLKLKPDSGTNPETIATVPEVVYESPAQVAIDELWDGYCNDMKGSSPECSKPKST